MSIELRPNTSKSLSGFSISPNPEVHDLESVLGIRFQQVPARIELGLRNRLILLAKEGVVRPFKDDTAGFYKGEYDAFFVRPGDDNRVTAWHENMHSYTQSTSLNGLPSLRSARALMLASINGEGVGPSRMEMVAVQATLNEGVSEWAAVSTAMEVGTEYEIKEAKTFHYESKTKDKLIGGNKSPLTASHMLLEKALIRLQSLLNKDPGLKTPLLFNEAVSQISKVSYYIGYYFVSEAILGLNKRGFSIPSAIDYLILHPPLKTQDLKNPKKFVFDRLGK